MTPGIEDNSTETLTIRARRLAHEAAVASEALLQHLADSPDMTPEQEDRAVTYGVEAGLKALVSIATSLAVLTGRPA